ncbi:MAG: hypothetical protein N2595_10535 [bacterium]|nr:hypothetical protein [bacterium]
MKIRRSVAAVIVTGALGWAGGSEGALAVWSNASGDCLWTNPANWAGGMVPGPGDNVLIPAGGHVTNIYLSGAGSPVLGTLVFSNSATLEWYVRDGGYVAVGVVIKTNAAVNIRESNGGFQINGDVVWEVGGPSAGLTFHGANQLAGNGRLWKTGTRALSLNTGGGHVSFGGGMTHSNGNVFLQSPNGLGQGAYRVQQAGNYPNLLLQFAEGEHIISNEVQLDFRSANIGVVLNSSGDINTKQRRVTYVGKFSRTATSFGGQYIGLVADRDGFLEFSTNVYVGDWSGMSNILIRVARGVHIFAAESAVPPVSSRLEINQVNIPRAVEPTATRVVFAGPYVVPCDVFVQFPLSNATPPCVLAANAPSGTVKLTGLIILDNRTNLTMVFEAERADTMLEIWGTITNAWPHMVVFRGPGRFSLSAPQGNDYSGGTQIKNGAIVFGMNVSNSCFGTGPVLVEGGAGIGGTGTFVGTLTLASGAHLYPGASVGTLSVGGNVHVGDGIVYHWEKGAFSSDSVVIGGNLGNLNGLTVIVYKVGSALPGGFVETNALFTFTGPAPAITNAAIVYDESSEWAGGVLGVGGNQVFITGILPEPGSAALLGVCGVIVRRRR